jgi:pilus assembly protein CpaF
MVQMGNMGLPAKAIRTQIVGAVDLIIQVERQRDGGRRLTQVTEVCGMDGEVVTMNDIFQLEILGEGSDGKLFGRYNISRVPPVFMRRLSYFGLDRAWKQVIDMEPPA